MRYIGAQLVIVFQCLLRKLGIEHFFLVRAISAVELAGFFDVHQETRSERFLVCQLIDLPRDILAKVVAQRNIPLDGGPQEKVCHLQSEEWL